MKILCLVIAVVVSLPFAAHSTDFSGCDQGGCPSSGVTAAFANTAGDALQFKNNWFLTGDYAVGGVGLRGAGSGGIATGTINIAGVPAHADIIAAYLYWETLGNGQNGTFRPQGAASSAIV